ncbi:ATP-grasp domain-containing protein [Methylomonas sp. EFPC3]|uniref:ATP-grasp domain-containing protein n=1 Tax=Methylomonas sp. EFPC3 TaxID=3021710 RepID=UPI0024172475|nr:ATP-grasp domain-containing protein [Methylomonas sp. EFPC3]WFP51656.1 ATP-grasp domain-containing protein [Methylomonas sp. EFPC3]
MKQLTILVFEYISGGGLAGEALPTSLLAEGRMMLQALLHELKRIPQIRINVPLDERCELEMDSETTEWVRIGAGQDIMIQLPELLGQADLFWPIAPETGGILQSLADLARNNGIETLLSDAATLTLCADKLATYRHLAAHSIPAVATYPAHQYPDFAGRVVIKVADGAGCQDTLVADATALPTALAALNAPQRYVVQPLVEGRAISLSALFNNGKGYFLTCNQQQIVLEQQRFHLRGCLVNIDNECSEHYRNLVDRIAAALPGLWGYAGIDLIETAESGAQVLEINPRLTSSYVGIGRATGINVAAQVLRLRDDTPSLVPTRQQCVEVAI